MSIKEILKTKEGALKLKEKLDSMTEEERKNPNFHKIKSMTCNALMSFGVKIERKKFFKKPKYSFEKKMECLEELQKYVSNRFELENPKPLQLGIDKILAEKLDGKMSIDSIKIALKFYCSRKRYLVNGLKLKQRYDLDGNYHSDITEEHLDSMKNGLIGKYGFKVYKKTIELKD